MTVLTAPSPAPVLKSQASSGSKVTELPSDVVVASLATISLERLRAGDQNEAKKLFEACKNSGFFYLDLQTSNDNGILKTINDMFALDKDLYDLDDEEKIKYDVDKLSKLKLNGYKPVGRNFGGIKGKRDGFETYAIPKDGLMGFEEFAHPAVIDQYWQTLQDFNSNMHVVIKAILSSLSTSLELAPDGRFEDFHRPHVPSPDIVRLLKYHAQPIEERGAAHTPHTDLGSLTILFTKQPGLQILAPGADHWAWVQPKAGYAVVNLGDGMSKLTNRYLHSCLHRVAPLPDRAMETRYSLAYLLRAEDRTPMTGLKSPWIPLADPDEEVVTSGEWIGRKFSALRLGTHETKTAGSVLTGQKHELPQQ
ncbi:MAG: hypothetical protein M1825_000563 [Sarcosagium campestre]|nr:MAG: hypothetical protein M1825_000563 [Sarcosagium campestre]